MCQNPSPISTEVAVSSDMTQLKQKQEIAYKRCQKLTEQFELQIT